MPGRSASGNSFAHVDPRPHTQPPQRTDSADSVASQGTQPVMSQGPGTQPGHLQSHTEPPRCTDSADGVASQGTQPVQSQPTKDDPDEGNEDEYVFCSLHYVTILLD